MGNVVVMATDDSWRKLSEGWARLKWARERWQLQTSDGEVTSADAAAKAMGMKPGTYRAYERAPGASKFTALDYSSAIRFGKAFGVDWIWLLTGQGSPAGQALSDYTARVVSGMGTLNEDQQRAVADLVDSFAGAKPSKTKARYSA